MSPDDKEFAIAKSMLMSNMGSSPHIEYVQVLRIFKVRNSVLAEKYKKYRKALKKRKDRGVLEKKSRIGFYNTTEREHLDIALLKGDTHTFSIHTHSHIHTFIHPHISHAYTHTHSLD